MPILERLGGAAELRVGVADVLEHRRIIARDDLRGAEEIAQRIFELPFFEMHPAAAIEIRAVIGIELERFTDHLLGLIEMHIVLGPHEPKIVVGFGGF